MDSYEDLVAMLVEVQNKLSKIAEGVAKLDPDTKDLIMIHYYGHKLLKAFQALDIPMVTLDSLGHPEFLNPTKIAKRVYSMDEFSPRNNE